MNVPTKNFGRVTQCAFVTGLLMALAPAPSLLDACCSPTLKKKKSKAQNAFPHNLIPLGVTHHAGTAKARAQRAALVHRHLPQRDGGGAALPLALAKI